jgi:hypothetical protein
MLAAMDARRRVHSELFDKMIEEIEAGPTTKEDLAAALGVTTERLRRFVRDAIELKLIHIGDWERNGHSLRPIYYIGKGQPAQRLTRLSAAQRWERAKENEKRKLVRQMIDQIRVGHRAGDLPASAIQVADWLETREITL